MEIRSLAGGRRRRAPSPELLVECGFETLSVSILHALTAGALTTVHRDPFDRMLIAQATLEELTLVTKDTAISNSFTNVLW